jgi:hypothetical protein
MRGSVARWTVAVLLVAASLTAGLAAADAAGLQEENETTSDKDELSLEELRRDGRSYSDAPPSVRIDTDAERMWWVNHFPASEVMVDTEEENGQYLKPGETVDRPSVFLRTIKASEGTETHTVRIAYYNIEERTVTVNGTTTTREVATNVTVQEQQVEVGPGWPKIEVPLRDIEGQRHVTMWIEGSQSENLRWTFKYDPVATSESVAISTQGDYLSKVTLEFLLPIVIGAFGAGMAARRLIQKAGIGPQWGYFWWSVGIGSVTFAVVLSQFASIAELLAHAPILAAGWVSIIIGIVVLETYQTNVKRVLFMQPVIQESESPSGDKAVDAPFGHMVEERLVTMPDGWDALVRPGLIPFLSRCFGGAARLYTESEDGERKEIQTRLELPKSRWDEIVFVDDEASTVLDYQPESWTLDFPDVETLSDGIKFLTIGAVVAMVALSLSEWLGTAWGVGLAVIALAVVLLEPVDGHARVNPAPAHARQAMMTALYLSTELDDAKTIDEARSKIIEQQATRQQDIDAALETQDSTLIESMFGNDDDDLRRELEQDVEGADTEAVADD